MAPKEHFEINWPLPCKAWSIVVELCLRFRTEAGGIIIFVGILRFGFVIRVLCFWTFPGFMTSLYCLTSPWLPYKSTPGRLKSKITRSPSAISFAMSMLSRTLLSKSLELKNFIDQVLFECKMCQETLQGVQTRYARNKTLIRLSKMHF